MSQIITTKHLNQQYDSEEDLIKTILPNETKVIITDNGNVIKKIFPLGDFEEYDSLGKKDISIRRLSQVDNCHIKYLDDK